MEMKNIASCKNSVCLIGYRYSKQDSFYFKPCSSSFFDIQYIKKENNSLEAWNIDFIKRKLVVLTNINSFYFHCYISKFVIIVNFKYFVCIFKYNFLNYKVLKMSWLNRWLIVVKFDAEDTVEAVPNTWYVKGKSQYYWPSEGTAKNIIVDFI